MKSYDNIELGAIMRKRPLRSDSRATVQQIVEGTSRLLDTHPLHEVTISIVAKTTGVARTTIYDFFQTPFAIFQVIARDHVMGSWNWIHVEIEKAAPTTLDALIDASVDAASRYFNTNGAARKTLFGSGSLELHVIESDWDLMSARMYRDFLQPDWPVEPFSVQDPFRTIGILMSAIYATSVRRWDAITPEMADEARLVSRAYIAAREREMGVA